MDEGLVLAVAVGVEVELLSGVGVAVGVAVSWAPVTLISTVLLLVPSESVTVSVTV